MTHQHLCLDRAYNSKSIENEIIKRGDVLHIPYKRKKRADERRGDMPKKEFFFKDKI